MTTVVVLLRGVNVGGRNRLPMAELRTALEGAGLARVRTYIQSGNVVAEAPAHDAEAVAAHVRAVIARTFHLDIPAIGLTQDELHAVIAANPYPDEPDPKRLHAIVLPYEPTEAMLHALAHRTAAVAEGGDSVTCVGRVAYLHTPDGFGTSALAGALTSAAKANPLADGTARNWATVTALADLCRE